VVAYEVKRITIKKVKQFTSEPSAEGDSCCGEPQDTGLWAAVTSSLLPVVGIWVMEHPIATRGQLVLKSQVGWVCCHSSDTFWFFSQG